MFSTLLYQLNFLSFEDAGSPKGQIQWKSRRIHEFDTPGLEANIRFPLISIIILSYAFPMKEREALSLERCKKIRKEWK
jgi:hypothetical protein